MRSINTQSAQFPASNQHVQYISCINDPHANVGLFAHVIREDAWLVCAPYTSLPT